MRSPVTKKRKPIVKDRLRAAWQAGGFESRNKLAKKAGVSHTAISRVLSGRVRRVNDRTLRRLSRALRVPAEWLTGERKGLPYVQEFEYLEAQRPKALGSTKKASSWERPTTDLIRWSWLMQRLEAAIRRDLTDWCPDDAAKTYDRWGRSLLDAFAELARSHVWRLALQAAAREGAWDPLWRAEDEPTIVWLEHALDPWLEGGAYLNADVIRELFGVLRARPLRFLDSKTRDAQALQALEEYEKLCDRAVKQRLAEDLGPDEDD